MEKRQAEANQTISQPAGEAIHLREVEIDFSMPFVRKVTMRNATAWSQSTAPVVVPEAKIEKRSKLRKAGLLGASGALAVMAGIIARKVGPLANHRRNIIDVSGEKRS